MSVCICAAVIGFDIDCIEDSWKHGCDVNYFLSVRDIGLSSVQIPWALSNTNNQCCITFKNCKSYLLFSLCPAVMLNYLLYAFVNTIDGLYRRADSGWMCVCV